MRLVTCLMAVAVSLAPSCAFALCDSFSGSTMTAAGVEPAKWRTDYPSAASSFKPPWKSVAFASDPQGYMTRVLATIQPYLKRDDGLLKGDGGEPWWISKWLDYTTSGREPLMGLTKERGPDAGDLSPTSTKGPQVWAVGFYNEPGATVLAQVFKTPCDVALPAKIVFPEGAASIKFLFTDADPSEVPYLQGAPEYRALIDAQGSSSSPKPVSERTERSVRLLQVDIAVKDADAQQTGWVFGTFAWIGPPKGDQLFDNLTPVTLQWGNDQGVYDQTLSETWVNAALKGALFGWKERPTLGFNGRANGPADNVRSSCLSCHAAARTPRSSKGLLDARFRMPDDLAKPEKVKAHVDVWFKNIPAGDLFDPAEHAVSALDYSLQLEAAAFRICRACAAGALAGATPGVCRAAKFYDQPHCGVAAHGLSPAGLEKLQLEAAPPPRQ